MDFGVCQLYRPGKANSLPSVMYNFLDHALSGERKGEREIFSSRHTAIFCFVAQRVADFSSAGPTIDMQHLLDPKQFSLWILVFQQAKAIQGS